MRRSIAFNAARDGGESKQVFKSSSKMWWQVIENWRPGGNSYIKSFDLILSGGLPAGNEGFQHVYSISRA